MLYIFDVDGTLVRSFLREAGAEFGQKTPAALLSAKDAYDRVEVLPGRQEKIDRLASDGATFAIATNQAGAVLGYQTVEQVHAKMGAVCAALEHFRRRPYSVHVAFEHPRARDRAFRPDPFKRRKPGPGLLLEAMKAHGRATAVFVGDMDTDREAARRAFVPYLDAEEFFS